MERENALALVHQYVNNDNLIKHMLAVEAAMRFYARKLDQDEETFALAGLLHDFDWEIHPNIEQHPLAGEPILREAGVPNVSLLDKTLYACDEVTGLITAVALVRPSRSIFDLESKSVKKKWKDKAFAAGANREEIASAAEEFGVELWQHVDNVIIAMRSVAADLDLVGQIES